MHEDLKDPKKHLTRIEKKTKKHTTKDLLTEIMKTWSATPKTYVLAIP